MSLRSTTTPAAPPPREGGFSLVDCTTAVAIVVIVLTALCATATQQATQRQNDAETRLAFVAALNNIEELRAVPVTSLPGMHGSGFDVPGEDGSPQGLAAVPHDDDGLPGMLTVEVERTTGGSRLYRVAAIVEWVGRMGRRRIVIDSLVGGRP